MVDELTPEQQDAVDLIAEAAQAFCKTLEPLLDRSNHSLPVSICLRVDAFNRTLNLCNLGVQASPEIVLMSQIGEQGATAFLGKVLGSHVTISAHAIPREEMQGEDFTLDYAEPEEDGEGAIPN